MRSRRRPGATATSGYYTDWRKMLEDPAVELFDNGGPNNLHAEPCILAMQAGKHVVCEKPLARTAEEAKTMLDAANKAGIKHMAAFNYRFIPAIIQARQLIESGALGRIFHCRAAYMQEWIMPHYPTTDIWRLKKEISGSGALGDLGGHVIDLCRFLNGEIKSVQGIAQDLHRRSRRAGRHGRSRSTWTTRSWRPWSSRTARSARWKRLASPPAARTTRLLEINGEKGTIVFDLERMNELQVFWVDDKPRETQGFHTVQVSEGYHPWWKHWWPHGHIIGWEHLFVHELTHFLDCIVNDRDVQPWGATFEDGYRAAVVCDAITRSAAERRVVDVKY